MKLKDILSGVNFDLIRGNLDTEITNIDYDSRKIKASGLYIAIKWTHIDGHDFINQAIKNGAKAVVTDKTVEVADKGITIVKVNDSYKNLFALSSNFYGNPMEKLSIIGITGTNGKTTTTYLLKSIFEMNEKVAVIGTIKYIIGDKVEPAPNTTPDALILNRLFDEIVNSGIKTVIMEVSSHSIALGRINGMEFDTVAFTNLSREHLDFHGNMENYFAVKSKLFKEFVSQRKIVNIDDEYGKRLYDMISGNKYAYSIKKKADFFAENINVSKNGIKFNLVIEGEKVGIISKLLGEYNVANIVLASAVAFLKGFTAENIKRGIEKVDSVEGRTELIEGKSSGIDAIVDYAHTPDALERLLEFAKSGSHWNRIILVFGCGGERDREKRPRIGTIACKYADEIIVTNDNPRGESPEKIIEEIKNGMKCDFKVETDRSKAIEVAINSAKKGDLVIVAGKGHENYQIIGNKKRYFSDRDEILKRLK